MARSQYVPPRLAADVREAMQEEYNLSTIKAHQEEGIIQLVRPWIDVAPQLFVCFPTGYGKSVIMHGAGTMLAGLTTFLCLTVGLCADQMEALKGPTRIVYALPWMKGSDILELFKDLHQMEPVVSMRFTKKFKTFLSTFLGKSNRHYYKMVLSALDVDLRLHKLQSTMTMKNGMHYVRICLFQTIRC